MRQYLSRIIKKPWLQIVKKHVQHSSKTMVNNHQEPLSTIIKNNGQTSSKTIQEGILSRSLLSTEMYANWPGFFGFFQEMSGSENCRFSTKKRLTIYKRHQMVITELEIGAAGTDFSRRTSWWAREDLEGPEHGKTCTFMKCIQMQKVTEHG
jgi:hypothetical protein